MSPKLPAGVSVYSAEFVFLQDADTAGPNDHTQQLTVSTMSQDDTIEGTYLVLKTDRWAVDSPGDLTALLAFAMRSLAGMPKRAETIIDNASEERE